MQTKFNLELIPYCCMHIMYCVNRSIAYLNHTAIPSRPNQDNESTGNDGKTITVSWKEPNKNTQREIDSFYTMVDGECGNCTNLGSVDRQIKSLTCTGWKPNSGKSCNANISSVIKSCNFTSKEPLVVNVPLVNGGQGLYDSYLILVLLFALVC